jgi:hypothetical protein
MPGNVRDNRSQEINFYLTKIKVEKLWNLKVCDDGV